MKVVHAVKSWVNKVNSDRDVCFVNGFLLCFSGGDASWRALESCLKGGVEVHNYLLESIPELYWKGRSGKELELCNVGMYIIVSNSDFDELFIGSVNKKERTGKPSILCAFSCAHSHIVCYFKIFALQTSTMERSVLEFQSELKYFFLYSIF